MPLIDLDAAKTWCQIAEDDASWDAFLEAAILGVSAAIDRYIGYPIERAAGIEYYDGNGYHELALRRRPVSTVTEVRLDPTGYYGQTPDGFGSTTLLVAGVDYAIKPGRGGLLVRLRSPSEFPWHGLYAGRTVSPVPTNATWPLGIGNIMVSYTAGYDPIPDDIQMAAKLLISFAKATGPQGGARLMSESLGDYQYSLGGLQSLSYDALREAAELGTARSLLAPYRELAL